MVSIKHKFGYMFSEYLKGKFYYHLLYSDPDYKLFFIHSETFYQIRKMIEVGIDHNVDDHQQIPNYRKNINDYIQKLSY